MRYDSIPGDGQIAKIGYGTSGIVGRLLPHSSQDARALTALRAALELGCTHFDTAEMYASGRAEELLGQAVRDSGRDRQGLFITSKVQPAHLLAGSVRKACDGSLRRLGMGYIDLYLIHWPNPALPLKNTFRALNQLVREGKVRHVGVSNFNLGWLKKARELCETPLATNQVPYSLEHRSYVKNGVLTYCQQDAILWTAYSPVERGRLRVNESLKEIAEAHGATPYQIALAWLVSQPRVITIPMSLNPEHIAENLAAADIELSPEELTALEGVESIVSSG
jgi:diketogulonate reductase-like aldo/keto reductase